MANRDLEELELEEEQDHREEIAMVAYSYWQSRGCIDGHDVEDWLMAEEEVFRRHAVGSIETLLAEHEGARQREARTAA